MYDTDVPILANIIDISPLTLLVVLVLALLILGPGKLPEVAGALGKSIREFRRSSTDLQESMRLDPPATTATETGTTTAVATGPAEPVSAGAVPVAPAPSPAASADVDAQARIRMLEERLAALEQDRGAAASKTDS